MARAAIFTMNQVQIVEDGTIVDGILDIDELILITSNGTQINIGNIRGSQGPPGDDAANVAWTTMTTNTPDFASGRRRFKRVLTADETLNIPAGTDGQMVLIRYFASGANRIVSFNSDVAFPAEFTSIPSVVHNTSLLLSFMYSAERGKWVCVSFASGV